MSKITYTLKEAMNEEIRIDTVIKYIDQSADLILTAQNYLQDRIGLLADDFQLLTIKGILERFIGSGGFRELQDINFMLFQYKKASEHLK